MSHLLEVKNLTTVFRGDYGKTTGVSDVSFAVDAGEIVCVVGESGCGKSVTALSVMGLLPRGGSVDAGEAIFNGGNLFSMTQKELDEIRGDALTMIFQDPLTSLNPAFTVGNQILESIQTHMHLSRNQARERAISMLKKVGLPDVEDLMNKYPHQLSGGMRQRVMIVMAISCNPKLLIADEPTTALDVTVQAQIMRLLRDLQKENGMAVLLITHDIGLVANMADRVLVMYAGQIVEEADVISLFEAPKHPYTKALLDTVPSIRDSKDRALSSIPGMVPERYDTLQGCRFAERCPYARKECELPQAMQDFGEGHLARCIVSKEGGIAL